MTETAGRALSASASALFAELRSWVAALPPGTVSLSEDSTSGYGGVLLHVRPTRPGTMNLAVGAGVTEDVDFFWGEGYRWEGWKATTPDVLEVCEAIKAGDVLEETWTIGPIPIEKRSYIRAAGLGAGDGSAPMPKWIKRWAKRSTRTFAAWVAGEAV